MACPELPLAARLPLGRAGSFSGEDAHVACCTGPSPYARAKSARYATQTRRLSAGLRPRRFVPLPRGNIPMGCTLEGEWLRPTPSLLSEISKETNFKSAPRRAAELGGVPGFPLIGRSPGRHREPRCLSFPPEPVPREKVRGKRVACRFSRPAYCRGEGARALADTRPRRPSLRTGCRPAVRAVARASPTCPERYP